MIKINSIKTIALATALTAGTACIAQNRLQSVQKHPVTVTQKQNGKQIYNELMNLIEHPEPKVVPGILWGTRTIYVHDKNKILATYKKVNENNVKEFLQQETYEEGMAYYVMYRRVSNILYDRHEMGKSEARDHMENVLLRIAAKNGKNIDNQIKDLRGYTDGYGFFDRYVQIIYNKANGRSTCSSGNCRRY